MLVPSGMAKVSTAIQYFKKASTSKSAKPSLNHRRDMVTRLRSDSERRTMACSAFMISFRRVMLKSGLSLDQGNLMGPLKPAFSVAGETF